MCICKYIIINKHFNLANFFLCIVNLLFSFILQPYVGNQHPQNSLYAACFYNLKFSTTHSSSVQRSILIYLKKYLSIQPEVKPILIFPKEPNFRKLFINCSQSFSQIGLLKTQITRTLPDSKQATFSFFLPSAHTS